MTRKGAKARRFFVVSLIQNSVNHLVINLFQNKTSDNE